MRAYPVYPGVPAAGHVAGGFWHPGQADGCVKCEPPDLAWRRRAAEHLKAEHGYATLDTRDPVSRRALLLIMSQCGCTGRCFR